MYNRGSPAPIQLGSPCFLACLPGVVPLTQGGQVGQGVVVSIFDVVHLQSLPLVASILLAVQHPGMGAPVSIALDHCLPDVRPRRGQGGQSTRGGIHQQPGHCNAASGSAGQFSVRVSGQIHFSLAAVMVVISTSMVGTLIGLYLHDAVTGVLIDTLGRQPARQFGTLKPSAPLMEMLHLSHATSQ